MAAALTLEVAGDQTAALIGANERQCHARQSRCAREDQIPGRPDRVELLFVLVQPLEVVELVEVLVYVVQGALHGWIIRLLADARKGAESKVEAAVTLLPRPFHQRPEQKVHV